MEINNLLEKRKIYIFFFFSIIFFTVIFSTKLILYLKGYCNHDILMYSNALWNTNILGPLLTTDLNNFSPGETFLIDHFSPTLLLLYPIYKLIPSPIILLAIQTIMPVLSGYLILLICKQLKINPLFSLLFCLVYIFNIVNIIGTIDGVYGFHIDCLVPFFFFLCCYAYLKNKIYLYCLSLFFFLGIKEDILIYSLAIFLLNYFYFVFLKKDKNKFKLKILNFSILISTSLAISSLATAFFLKDSILTPHQTNIIEMYSIYNFFYFFLSLKWWLIIFSFFPSLFGFPYFLYAYPFVYNFGTYYPDIGLSTGFHYTYHWFIILAITCISAIILFHKTHNFSGRKKSILISVTLFFFIYNFCLGFYKTFSKFNKSLEKPYLHKVKSVKKINSFIPKDTYLFVSLPIRHKFINRKHIVKNQNNNKIIYAVVLKNNFKPNLNFQKNFSKIHENEEIIILKKK